MYRHRSTSCSKSFYPPTQTDQFSITFPAFVYEFEGSSFSSLGVFGLRSSFPGFPFSILPIRLSSLRDLRFLGSSLTSLRGRLRFRVQESSVRDLRFRGFRFLYYSFEFERSSFSSLGVFDLRSSFSGSPFSILPSMIG